MAAFFWELCKIAYRTLHALFQPLQILGFALFFPSELIGLLARQARAIRAERLAHLSFERLLAPGQLIRLPRQILHLIGGFLAAHSRKHLLGFLQAVCRAPRLRLALRRSRLLRGSCAAHILHRLVQTIQHLLHLLRIGTPNAILLILHRPLLRVLLLLLAGLTLRRLSGLILLTLLALLLALLLLAGLPLGLALLALLPLLALLALLTLLLSRLLALLLLPVAAQLLALLALGHLLQLPLQLLRLAPQHLLLPALLGSLLLPLLLLIGQLLLTLGQLFQLLQRFIDLLLLLLLLAGGLRLIVLVLILFGIQFEIEQPFHVARPGAAATASAALLVAERHLNIAGRRFGAHQVLERLLLRTAEHLSNCRPLACR